MTKEERRLEQMENLEEARKVLDTQFKEKPISQEAMAMIALALTVRKVGDDICHAL